ncbi:MAG: thioredoxin family protein [Candidatus Woesearchaeota archaeon]
MKIEVLGSGCSKCKMLEENAKKALEERGIEADIIKVTDFNKFVDYGVMSTPALVIDGVVKCSGKVADVEEIKKWL